MSGMVLHTELLFDHPGDHRRGPHSAIQSVGHRTTVENVSELFSLPLRQHRRPTGPVALEQTLDPMSLIARQPLGNPGAWRFENFRQFATRPTFGIQNYGLHPFRHAIGTIPLRFFAQDNQSMICLRMQSQHARNHGYTSARSMPHSLVLCPFTYAHSYRCENFLTFRELLGIDEKVFDFAQGSYNL